MTTKEKYIKARAFDELKKSDAYEYLSQYLNSEIDDIILQLKNGLADQEHDSVVKMRTYTTLLHYIDQQVASLPRLKQDLARQGINIE